MRLSVKQQGFTLDIAKLIVYADSIGVGLTFSEALRTKSQQLLYYHGYKIIEVNNKLVLDRSHVRSWTKSSKHLSRLAVDFNFFINGELFYKHELIDKLGEYWVTLSPDNIWGKSFGDSPHFQG